MKSDAAIAARFPAFPWAVAVLVLAGASCGHVQSTDGGQPASSSPEVIEVAAAEYMGEAGDPLENACRDWRLSRDQVAEFFRLSRRYEQSPYAGFYQLPCSISGKLRSEGVTWDFTIGGGAAATWSHDGQTRYFGCNVDACEPLVLLPADDMDPQ